MTTWGIPWEPSLESDIISKKLYEAPRSLSQSRHQIDPYPCKGFSSFFRLEEAAFAFWRGFGAFLEATNASNPFFGILGGFVATIPLWATSLVDVAKFFTLVALVNVAGEVVPSGLVSATSYFVITDDFAFAIPLDPSTFVMVATYGILRACYTSIGVRSLCIVVTSFRLCAYSSLRPVLQDRKLLYCGNKFWGR